MQRDVFTLIVGGKAGQGAKKAGAVAAAIFADLDRAVFQYDDYPSLIRGGHNFAVVSTAPDEISSHYLAAQLVRRSGRTQLQDTPAAPGPRRSHGLQL